MTESINNTSDDLGKTMMLTYKENNKVQEKLNNRILETMTDRGVIASYLTSPQSKITNLEKTSELKLVKSPNSNKLNDLSIQNTKPVTFYYIWLTFRDTVEVYELIGGLLEMISIKNYHVDLASLSDT